MFTRQILTLLFFLVNLSVFAREFPPKKIDTTKTEIIIEDTTMVVNQEILILWTKKNAVGVTFNEVAFVNWNSGGNNSISALFFGNFQRKYQKNCYPGKQMLLYDLA